MKGLVPFVSPALQVHRYMRCAEVYLGNWSYFDGTTCAQVWILWTRWWTLGFHKMWGNSLNAVSNYQLLKMDSAPWMEEIIRPRHQTENLSDKIADSTNPGFSLAFRLSLPVHMIWGMNKGLVCGSVPQRHGPSLTPSLKEQSNKSIFTQLSLKGKATLMRLSFCLSVCLSVCVSPQITSEPVTGFL
jgi:hypothetical protein